MIRKSFSIIQLYWREAIAAVLPVVLLFPLVIITSQWISLTLELFKTDILKWLTQVFGSSFVHLFFSLFNYFVCTIVGIVLGILYKQRGLRLALIFGISMFLTQTYFNILTKTTSIGWGIILVNLGYIVLPVTSSWLMLRHYPQKQPGYCTQCSYNLTGNESGTCPECGKAI